MDENKEKESGHSGWDEFMKALPAEEQIGMLLKNNKILIEVIDKLKEERDDLWHKVSKMEHEADIRVQGDKEATLKASWVRTKCRRAMYPLVKPQWVKEDCDA